jgi:hypothetical protein
MGQAESTPSKSHDRRRGENASPDISLWEGVPPPIRWLVQSQVRLLLMNHPGALLYRPEQLHLADYDQQEQRTGAPQALGQYEMRLANAAIRDRSLAPRLQRVLDRLVPSQLTEAQFWDNFFSHVDVTKVRLVTDYLRAQDLHASAKREKLAGWEQQFDSLSAELQEDVKHASEAISAEVIPPEPTAAEVAVGFEPATLPRWAASEDATWAKYAEDGPFEELGIA